MYPFLKDGDLVLLESKPSVEYRCGNVLVFEDQCGEYTIHRLVKKTKGNLLHLQGDGYNLATETVDKNTVLGKAIGIHRDGSFIRFTRTKELISWVLSIGRKNYIHIRKKVISNHGYKSRG